jgi:hypothetical protein
MAGSSRFRPLRHHPKLGRVGGEKSQTEIETAYLDRALDIFSGYIAVDELYQDPFCVLSLVDNRTFTRLSYRVLERDPTAADIHSFLVAFKARLDARGLSVKGITTDGSVGIRPLVRSPLRLAGDQTDVEGIRVPHQANRDGQQDADDRCPDVGEGEEVEIARRAGAGECYSADRWPGLTTRHKFLRKIA